MSILTLWRKGTDGIPQLYFSVDWFTDLANPGRWEHEVEKCRKEHPDSEFKVIRMDFPDDVVGDAFDAAKAPVKRTVEMTVLEETD